MVATLSSSLPSPTTILHSISSHSRPWATSIAPSPSFCCEGLNGGSAGKLFAHFPKRSSFRTNRWRTWAAEDEEANPVEETRGDMGEGGGGGAEQQPTVVVPLSPLDTLTMFFQIEGKNGMTIPVHSDLLAEGTMSDSAVGMVAKALEGTEGITDLKVQIIEGIGSVELTKQTTIQATGAASGLVETIQGAGFKLQTLNLSFEDQEEVVLS